MFETSTKSKSSPTNAQQHNKDLFFKPVIQKQDAGEEYHLPPAPTERIDWLGLNRTMFNRGIMNPGDYGAASQQEWGRQYNFYAGSGLGNVAGGVLGKFGLKAPGGDWNAWMANKTTPLSVDSALSRDNPTFDEAEERRGGLPNPKMINIPIVNFKLENGSPASNSPSSEHAEEYIGSLNGKGDSINESDKTTYESAFDSDFSNVKVHTDSRANESAKSLNARAYTTGNNIVFAAGEFDPSSERGKKLLAHELTHVVQQNDGLKRKESLNGTNVQRQTTGPGVPPPVAQPPVAQPPAVQPDVAVRQWLEAHQFAPPEQQPAEGERHVLLNGQDMSITDASQLAIAGTHQPPELVRSIITAAVTRSVIPSLTGSPIIGLGNEIPGLSPSLFNRSGIGGIDPILGKSLDFQTIDQWLDDHHFYQLTIPDPTGDRVMFDGQQTTIEALADRALAIVGGGGAGSIRVSYVNRQDVLIHLRQKYVSAPSGPGWQMVMGYTLVPAFSQTATPIDPSNPLQTQHQFSFTITRAHHDSNSPGLETSFQGSVTIDNSGNIVNLQTGVQEALVRSLLGGWIQVSGFVQVMASANWGRTASGTATVTPAIQAAAGAQILLTPPLYRQVRMLNGHVALGSPQVGLQVLGSVQGTSQGPQVGASVGLVINIPFNLL